MSDDRIVINDIRERIKHGLAMEELVPARDQATLSWGNALALVNAVDACRYAVAESALVIEVLRAQNAEKPYRELSPSMVGWQLDNASDALRLAARYLGRFDFRRDEVEEWH